MVSNTIKKTFTVFTLSFLGVWLPYLAYLVIIFLSGIEPLMNLADYIDIILSITPLIVLFALFLTTILYIASLLDKRVLNKWFVLGFAAIFSIIGLVSQFTSYLRSI